MKKLFIAALLLISGGLNACEIAKEAETPALTNKQKVDAIDELVWSLEGYYSDINHLRYANLDTILIEAIKNEQGPELCRLLKAAVRFVYKHCRMCNRQMDIIERMLSEIKGLVNIPLVFDRRINRPTYLLHSVVALKEVDLVKLLLQYGADPLCKDFYNQTAFDQYSTQPKFAGGYSHIIKIDFQALSASVDLKLLPVLYNHASCDEATRKRFREIEQRIFSREKRRILEAVSDDKLEDLPAIFNNQDCLEHVRDILKDYYEQRKPHPVLAGKTTRN